MALVQAGQIGFRAKTCIGGTNGRFASEIGPDLITMPNNWGQSALVFTRSQALAIFLEEKTPCVYEWRSRATIIAGWNGGKPRSST